MSVPGWDLQRSNQISVPAEYGRIIAWWMVCIVNGGMFVPGFLASSADRPICGERKIQQQFHPSGVYEALEPGLIPAPTPELAR